MIVAEFGTGQVFWSITWFFLWFIWVWMLVVTFGDIFRSRDLGGWTKALWSLFIIVLPYLGVFVYLVARGGKMQEHAAQDARERDAMFRTYVQDVAGDGHSSAAQLTQLADLRSKGVLTDAEFEQAKARTLA